MRAVINIGAGRDFTLKRIIKLEVERLLYDEKIAAKCYFGAGELVIMLKGVESMGRAGEVISGILRRCAGEIEKRYLIPRPDLLAKGFKLIA